MTYSQFLEALKAGRKCYKATSSGRVAYIMANSLEEAESKRISSKQGKEPWTFVEVTPNEFREMKGLV